MQNMAGTYRVIPMGLSDGGWSPSELSHVKHARATKGLSWAWGGRQILINVWSMKNKKRDMPTALGRWSMLTDGREKAALFLFLLHSSTQCHKMRDRHVLFKFSDK